MNKTWDELSMAEKSEMIGVAVRNGITDLDTIRKKYNEFAEGGGISDNEYLAIMEKVVEDNNPLWNQQRIQEGKRPLSIEEDLIRTLNDNTYDYRGYYNKYPTSTANADIHWPDEFKTVYHPTFSNESRYHGVKSQYNPLGLPGGWWLGEDFMPMAWQLLGHEYKKGGPIHIEPSKKGTFTAAATKHGMGVQEFASKVLAHPENYSPAMRKKANFARNASKFKHSLGGPLVDRAMNYFEDGGFKEEDRFATTEMPELVVSAKRKYIAGYDENGNPIYTTDRTKSMSYEGVRPFESKYQRWANRDKNTPKYTDPIIKAAQIGIGVPLATIAGAPVAEASLPIMEVMARPLTTTTRVGSKLFPSLSKALPYTEMADRGLMGVMGASGMYDAGKKWYEGEMPWYQAVPQMGLSGLMMADAAPLVTGYFGKPVVPKGYLSTPIKEIQYNDLLTQAPQDLTKSKRVHNRERLIQQSLREAQQYKRSPQYKKLAKAAGEESESIGTGWFPEDTFVENLVYPKITNSYRNFGSLGSYTPSTNTIEFDYTQWHQGTPFHEGLHWQKVANPNIKVGPKYDAWAEAYNAGLDANFQHQLFNASYNDAVERARMEYANNAREYLKAKVIAALYPETPLGAEVRKPWELHAHGMTAGKAIGLKPFEPFPGYTSLENIDKVSKIISKAREYDPHLWNIKGGSEKDAETFWKILTGNYFPVGLGITAGIGTIKSE